MFARAHPRWLIVVAAAVLAGWLLGLKPVPLLLLTLGMVVLLQALATRIPIRDRRSEEWDTGRDLTRFGWGHPLATSLLWGGALFGWFNGTGDGGQIGTGSAGDGLGGADSLGGGDFLGGDFGGGGGAE